jgi:hypothetical protein
MVSGPAHATDPLSGAASAARPIASPRAGASVGPDSTGDERIAGVAVGDSRTDKAQQTGSLRIPMRRRRRLRGIVFATLAMCSLILIAAVISRVGHASNEAASLPRFPTSIPSVVAPSASAAVVAAPNAARLAPTPPTEPSTGTVRIDRPAVPGRVWLDGKKLTVPATSVSCGAHQVKVGRGHARSVQIPCGGEFVISR